MNNMPRVKIAICGIGYIGSVCLAGLASNQHELVGFDTDEAKIEAINSKRYKFPERDVENIVNTTSINATSNFDDILDSDILLVCLPTPMSQTGRLDVSIVRNFIEEVASRGFKGELIIRSTLPFVAELFTFFRSCGLNITVLPEFLREGSALKDFMSTEVLFVGTGLEGRSTTAEEIFKPFCKFIFRGTYEDAIFFKLLNNTWHALKVSFSNEWARVANSLGNIDNDIIHRAFISDSRLNTSHRYLRPGGPFGGPCLPKDISEFIGLCDDAEMPVISAAPVSNARHIEILTDEILAHCRRQNKFSICFDDWEFKKGTGDIRHSPIFDIVESLKKKSPEIMVEKSMSSACLVFDGRKILDYGRVEIVNA